MSYCSDEPGTLSPYPGIVIPCGCSSDQPVEPLLLRQSTSPQWQTPSWIKDDDIPSTPVALS